MIMKRLFVQFSVSRTGEKMKMGIMVMLVMATTLLVKAEDEKEECRQQLIGLATCLPYVGGDAKAPMPDCCNGLKEVLKSDKKCLCVIIKDRNDPDLSLNINLTLALSLPSICNAPANVSQCPALLHLDPKSPEAQVFYQPKKSSDQLAASPAPSATGNWYKSPSTGVAEKGGGIGSSSRDAGRHVAMNLAVGWTLLWYLAH